MRGSIEQPHDLIIRHFLGGMKKTAVSTDFEVDDVGDPAFELLAVLGTGRIFQFIGQGARGAFFLASLSSWLAMISF